MPTLRIHDIPLHYRTEGQGSPILFLHGMGTRGDMWEPQIPFFSREFRMIMPDLRGHGQSGPLPDNIPPDLYARDLKALLDHLRLEKTHVVGVSLGAVAALTLAIYSPSSVDRLVLADGYGRTPSRLISFLFKICYPLVILCPWKWIQHRVLALYNGSGPGQKRTRRMLKHTFSMKKENFLRLNRQKQPDFTPLLPRIHHPTLVMAGDVNPLELKGSRLLFKRIPHSQLTIFQGEYDPLNTMETNRFNEMVRDFLKGEPLKEKPGVRIFRHDLT